MSLWHKLTGLAPPDKDRIKQAVLEEQAKAKEDAPLAYIGFYLLPGRNLDIKLAWNNQPNADFAKVFAEFLYGVNNSRFEESALKVLRNIGDSSTTTHPFVDAVIDEYKSLDSDDEPVVRPIAAF